MLFFSRFPSLLLSTFFAATLACAADPDSLLAIWKTDLAQKIFYNGLKPYPLLVYPEIRIDAATGAAGSNIDYEAGTRPQYYIEEQRGGADLIQAGIVLHNEKYIDAGIRIMDWGFAKQQPDGSWKCPDVFHSATFFVEAAARSCLMLRESGLKQYAAKAEEWAGKLKIAGNWMLSPGVFESDKYTSLLCHRYYLCAAAYGETFAIVHDPRLDQKAQELARVGIAIQWPDGINPEKGGYDVGYQVAGLKYAFNYYCVCPDAGLKAQIKEMYHKGIDFELTRMDANGAITTEGSTRMGHEQNRRGETKVVGYLPAIQCLIGAILLTGDSKYSDDAILLAKAQGYMK